MRKDRRPSRLKSAAAECARASKPRPRGSVRARILTAATRLFAAQGFEGTTLQEVADAVGVRKPSVLHYFPTKEDLGEAVDRQILEHWSQVVPIALRDAGTGIGQFEALIRELINFYSEDPDRARLVLREALNHPQKYRRNFLEYILPWLGLISETIGEGQRHGICRPGLDAEMYLVHVVQLVIVTVATGGVLSGPAGAGARAALDRAVSELVRISHDSLFTHDAEKLLAPRKPDQMGRGDRAKR